MKLILRVLSGKKYGQRIVVARGQSTTVGRSNAAQNSFDDDHMSSLHFEVENFGSYAEVRDLRSTNRTWLNNNYIAAAPLKHGDRLRAGKTVLGVEIEHTAVVDDSGATPKPPLLESTSQVAMPQSKAERLALLQPGTGGNGPAAVSANADDPALSPQRAAANVPVAAPIPVPVPNVPVSVSTGHGPNVPAGHVPQANIPVTNVAVTNNPVPNPSAPSIPAPHVGAPHVVATPVYRAEGPLPSAHSPIVPSTAMPPAPTMPAQPWAVAGPGTAIPGMMLPASPSPAASAPGSMQPPVPLPPTSHGPVAWSPVISAPQPPAATPQPAPGDFRRHGGSPIESIDFRSADFRSADIRSADVRSADIRSADIRSAPERRPATPQSRERATNNPIVDSSSLYFGSPIQAIGDKRRFRQYERVGDFQTLHNLRGIVAALNMRKSVRIVAHFAKLRMIAPALSDAVPLYPQFPGAATHLPVSLTYRDWESESVQSVAMRLCTNDALLVVIGEFNADLSAMIQAVGADGVPGFCEPGGFLGWSWPSAFHGLLQFHGTRRWGEILGAGIDGVIMCSPMHNEVLLAFAAECLENELKAFGFTTVV